MKINVGQFLQAVLRQPRWLGCLFRSPTSFTRFLASAVGAKDTLSEFFGLEHEDGTYDALTLWFDAPKCEVSPENET